ncbi:hypothetical protein Pelo_1286 [Pelomyxa schiedti]|nr:hypothetical protein Pelo_1286 [Pelomyxa schiedti]
MHSSHSFSLPVPTTSTSTTTSRSVASGDVTPTVVPRDTSNVDGAAGSQVAPETQRPCDSDSRPSGSSSSSSSSSSSFATASSLTPPAMPTNAAAGRTDTMRNPAAAMTPQTTPLKEGSALGAANIGARGGQDAFVSMLLSQRLQQGQTLAHENAKGNIMTASSAGESGGLTMGNGASIPQSGRHSLSSSVCTSNAAFATSVQTSGSYDAYSSLRGSVLPQGSFTGMRHSGEKSVALRRHSLAIRSEAGAPYTPQKDRGTPGKTLCKSPKTNMSDDIPSTPSLQALFPDLSSLGSVNPWATTETQRSVNQWSTAEQTRSNAGPLQPQPAVRPPPLPLQLAPAQSFVHPSMPFAYYPQQAQPQQFTEDRCKAYIMCTLENEKKQLKAQVTNLQAQNTKMQEQYQQLLQQYQQIVDRNQLLNEQLRQQLISSSITGDRAPLSPQPALIPSAWVPLYNFHNPTELAGQGLPLQGTQVTNIPAAFVRLCPTNSQLQVCQMVFSDASASRLWCVSINNKWHIATEQMVSALSLGAIPAAENSAQNS